MQLFHGLLALGRQGRANVSSACGSAPLQHIGMCVCRHQGEQGLSLLECMTPGWLSGSICVMAHKAFTNQHKFLLRMLYVFCRGFCDRQGVTEQLGLAAISGLMLSDSTALSCPGLFQLCFEGLQGWRLHNLARSDHFQSKKSIYIYIMLR